MYQYEKPQSLATVASTGVFTGGILSIGTPNTTISISDGFGIINGDVTFPFNWDGLDNIPITNIATQTVTYITINRSGTVNQYSSRPSGQVYRDEIFIGVAVHTNLTSVSAVDNEQNVVQWPTNQLDDLFYGIGLINSSGNIISPNGANLFLNKSNGNILGSGINYNNNKKIPHLKNLPATTAFSFSNTLRNGTVVSTGTSVNPNIYDLAGVSTAVPNNKWTIQRIFTFPAGNIAVQLGQNIYNSLAEAKGAIQTETFVTFPSAAENGLLLCFMIVKQATTQLNNTTDNAFISAGKFGTTTGAGGTSVSSMQNTYDNSSIPQIITSTGNGAVTYRRGSAADTDNVFAIQNGAGSITANITGNGLITSVIPYTTLDGFTVRGSDIASAATTNIAAATGFTVGITGNVTITAFGTANAGVFRVLNFTGTPTLTHNATSLILPGGTNIVVVAGDTASFESLGGGNWRCVSYLRNTTIGTNKFGAVKTTDNTSSTSCTNATGTLTDIVVNAAQPNVIITGSASIFTAASTTRPGIIISQAGTVNITATTSWNGANTSPNFRLHLAKVSGGTTDIARIAFINNSSYLNPVAINTITTVAAGDEIKLMLAQTSGNVQATTCTNYNINVAYASSNT